MMQSSEAIEKSSIKNLFHVIHDYGPWQRNVFIVFFLINCIGMWHNFAITFMAPNVEFRCITQNNISGSELFPLDKNDSMEIVDQCHIFKLVEDSENSSRNSTNQIEIPCSEWDYNSTYEAETIVSEWNLVCDREWLISLSKSIYMIGFMASVLIFGQISDCVGRKPIIIICYSITCFSCLLSVFSTSYLMFVILRFFQAFGRTGLTTTGFVLLMEITGPKYRTRIGIAIQVGWTVGFVTLPAIAWFVKDWFWFQLATSIPLLPFIFTYWVIPESPRWLITQGKMKALSTTIKRATKANGQLCELDSEDINSLLSFQKVEGIDKMSGNLLDLFRTPRLRGRTLNAIYLWIVNAFVYYSLSYNTNDFGGDPYLNFFIAGVVEMPSYLIVYFVVSKFGRRIPLAVIMVAGGVTCAAIIFSPKDTPSVATTLAMIGKFLITGSFGVLYLYCSELFPTVVRNVAIGSCSTCARIGSILAPFVRELGKATHPAVPNAIYGLLAISSGLLALLLPETKDEKIPDTLEEGERFGLKEQSEYKFSLMLKDEDEKFP